MKEKPIFKKGKYAAFAEQDDCGINPYDDMDFMPPMMRFSLDRHHGGISREREFYASDIIKYIQAEHCDTKEKREKLIELFECDGSYRDVLREIAHNYYNSDGIASTFCQWIRDHDFNEPSYWDEAGEFFDRLEGICEIIGVTCINEITLGCCQGDAVRVFMVATPEWLKQCGLEDEDPENVKENLMSSFKTWSAWAWGDCYSYVIKPIYINKDGDEDYDYCVSSCGGYYGDDHDKSGLLEGAIDAINGLIARDEKEAVSAFEAACRDIVTV